MEVQVIKWIQSFRSDFLDSFFEGVTMFGEELVYIVIFSILYWCFDKREAIKIILIFLISVLINGVLKETFMRERPIGVEGIFSLREHTAEGYAFPSGHTQSAATFFYYIAYKLKNKWVTLGSTIMIVLVATSRLYLGVHWLTDVLGGIVLAIIIVRVGLVVFEEISDRKLLITLVLSNVLYLFFANDGLTVITAIITGAVIGMLLEQRFVNFERTATKASILRVLIGLLVVMLLKEGVKVILPETMFFDYIRYTLIGLWVAVGAPFTFLKVKFTK